MIMKTPTAILTLLFYLQLVQCSYDEAVEFKDTNVNILALYRCEDESISNFHDIELKNDGENKWAYFTIKLDEDFDETFMVRMTADQWDNGAWQENVYSTEGSFCNMIEQYGHDFYKNFREHMNPPLPEVCKYEKGDYTLNDFTCTPKDFDIPSMLMGTFKVNLEIINPAEEKIACVVCELEISAG
ncbi:unnamed protein product [Callosobruchus maculatus]|uniref:MD-2-related lipid-recognition domain-containing protein n=1 Tax=Callosobruchus maculatus TaxID=64391 RepID=A0A653CMZ5_CALMS|nr:unnamed protein product [Callosobruchus maculatus]